LAVMSKNSDAFFSSLMSDDLQDSSEPRQREERLQPTFDILMTLEHSPPHGWRLCRRTLMRSSSPHGSDEPFGTAGYFICISQS
jgi:hypothetical protein